MIDNNGHHHSPNPRLRLQASHVPVKYRSLLLETLAVRQKYSARLLSKTWFAIHPPHPVAGMEKEASTPSIKKTKSPIEFIRWPLPMEYNHCKVHDQSHPSIKNLDDGARSITSLDGLVEITESLHGQSIIVKYPAVAKSLWNNSIDLNGGIVAGNNTTNVEPTTGGVGDSDLDGITYVWVEQHHSAFDIPACWAYPYEFLRGALETVEMELLASSKSYIVSQKYVAIPFLREDDDEHKATAEPFNASLHSIFDTTATTPKSQIVKIMCDGEYVYRTYAHGHEVFVEATVLEDGATFRSCEEFSFLNLFTIESRKEEWEMYSIENAPHTAKNMVTGKLYPLPSMINEMMKLYQIAFQSRLRNQQRVNMQKKVTAVDSQPLEKVFIDGVGTVTLYHDGALHVRFLDGVVVEVAGRYTVPRIAVVTEMDGNSVRVRPENPIGYE
ncbi:hypothetical protein HDU76_007602, partial [Blyttiomyces sp. JEL0837]